MPLRIVNLDNKSKSALWKKTQTCSSSWPHLNPFSTDRSMHKAKMCCIFHVAVRFYNNTWKNRFCLPAFSWSHIFQSGIFSCPILQPTEAEGYIFPWHCRSCTNFHWRVPGGSLQKWTLSWKKCLVFEYEEQKFFSSSQEFSENQAPQFCEVGNIFWCCLNLLTLQTDLDFRS